MINQQRPAVKFLHSKVRRFAQLNAQTFPSPRKRSGYPRLVSSAGSTGSPGSVSSNGSIGGVSSTSSNGSVSSTGSTGSVSSTGSIVSEKS